MFRNYVVLAIRNFLKDKLVSTINLAGISIALAFGMLAVVFAYNELTSDLFHANVERIYRIRQRTGDQPTSRTVWSLGPAISSEFPDVRVVRVFNTSGSVAYGEKSLKFRVSYVDSSFLDVFSFPMAMGDASTALRDVRSIVITEKVARKLFQGENPIGKFVSLNKTKAFKINGVLSRLPENSSIKFDCLLPADSADEFLNSWVPASVSRLAPEGGPADAPGESPSFNLSMISVATTFVLLPEYLEPRNIEDRLPKVVQRAWGRQATATIKMSLQPLKEMRFDRRTRGVEPTSNPLYIYVFLGIALVVTTISSVNYSALAIGRMLSRAKEAGVRRLFGAGKRQFFSQYLVESVLMALMALVVGLGLMSTILPHFNSLVGVRISVYGQLSVATLLYVLLLTAVLGISAALYPALASSRLQPVDVLYGRTESVNPGFLMRLLLVIQYTMSMVLVMVALAMAAQLDFLVNKNPGFRTDGVVVVEARRLYETSPELVDVYANKLTTYPEIIGVARGQHPLSNKQSPAGFARADGMRVGRVENIAVDHGFLNTLGIEMLEGRSFSRLYSTDSNAVIINQALMKHFGWQNVTGKFIDWNGGKDAPIIGLVRDFHFKSFHRRVAPAVIFLEPEFCDIVYVLATSNEDRDVLDILREEWHKIAPSQPFRARFLEEDLRNQYKKDEKWLNAIQLPAVLALGLACLGAFSMTSFSVARRTKEIGIRKVFGTPVHHLMTRLTFEFFKIVILAATIAAPIAYLVLREWLQNFVYRVDLNVPIIVGAVLTFAFVMLTVSCKTYKTATQNPADTLRDE